MGEENRRKERRKEKTESNGKRMKERHDKDKEENRKRKKERKEALTH